LVFLWVGGGIPALLPVSALAETAPEATADAGTEAQRELRQYEDALKKVVDPMNAVNPFFTGVRPSAGPSSRPSAGPSGAETQTLVDQLQRSMENPFLKSLLQGVERVMERVMEDEKFSRALAQVWGSPDREKLFYGQGLGLVLLWILGAYRRSRVAGFLRRAWVSMSQALLALVVLGGVLPLIVFGAPWLDLMRGVSRVLVAQIPALLQLIPFGH